MAQAGTQSAAYVALMGESDSREMNVLSMDEDAIESLANGEKVVVYMQPSSPGPVLLIDPEPVSLAALRAFIPAVDKAVAELTEKNSSKVAFLVFPANDVDAYRKLFDWIDICVYAGKLMLFQPEVPKAGDIETFRTSVLRMGRELGLGWKEK